MKKAIIIIRESTKAQEIDSQKQDIINYAMKDGYSLEEIMIIGEAGASAIKLDEAYLRNMRKVYETIEDPNNSIKCVYAWAIDRIGRQEVPLFELKNYLVERKIQLIIKKPSLRLLEDDGSVNGGVELAFSLFATMSKQEMEMKAARFKRGKRRNAEQMKFNGGWCTKFGYQVNEDGYVIINQAEAEIVRLIFQEFSSGRYSVNSLTKELRNRGVVKPNGDKMTVGFIKNTLLETAYLGYIDDDRRRSHRKYPIIKEVAEVWDKVQSIKAKNNVRIKKGNKYNHLALKIIKCKECGHNYVANGKNYRCWNHFLKYVTKSETECNNSICIRIKYLDELLWDIASIEHADYISNFKDSTIQELESNISINNQKIEELLNRLNKIDNKRRRINELYMDGEINQTTHKQRLELIKKDNVMFKSERDRLLEENENIYKQIDDIKNADQVEAFLNQTLPIFEMTEKQKQYEIVHRHIKVCYLDRCKFENKKATVIEIHTTKGSIYMFYWLPRFSQLYKVNEITKEASLYKDYRETFDECKKRKCQYYSEVDKYMKSILNKKSPEEKLLDALR